MNQGKAPQLWGLCLRIWNRVVCLLHRTFVKYCVEISSHLRGLALDRLQAYQNIWGHLSTPVSHNVFDMSCSQGELYFIFKICAEREDISSLLLDGKGETVGLAPSNPARLLLLLPSARRMLHCQPKEKIIERTHWNLLHWKQCCDLRRYRTEGTFFKRGKKMHTENKNERTCRVHSVWQPFLETEDSEDNEQRSLLPSRELPFLWVQRMSTLRP